MFLMTNIDTSFIKTIMCDLFSYVPIINNILDRFKNIINIYSCLFIFMLPFYLYDDYYFVIKNVSHPYLALSCSIYFYNKSTLWFLGVPVMFILDRMFKFPYDSIVYVMVFVVITTFIELLYTFVHMVNYVVNSQPLSDFINTFYKDIKDTHEIDSEQSSKKSSKQSSKKSSKQSSKQSSKKSTEQSDEHPNEQTNEQSDEQSDEQSGEQSDEQSDEQPDEQPDELKVLHKASPFLSESGEIQSKRNKMSAFKKSSRYNSN